MKALVFRRSVPRYVLLKLLAGQLRRIGAHRIAPVSLCDIPEPRLPTPHWVRIAPTLAGICGSDLATICAKGTPYLAPLTSMPFVLGHELVGRIIEIGSRADDFSVGDRVVIHPALGCKARGIDPPCDACRDRRDALCRNLTRGDIPAGVQTGYCRGLGGGFADQVVAHRSQVYRVPDEIDDRAAVLIEPFACALHGALRVKLSSDDTALVIGCGAIGLLAIAALRATGCKARIVAAARYEHQRTLARSLGADELIRAGGEIDARYHDWAKSLDAEVLAPELGKPTVLGGATAVFDCVASSQSIDDGLRFTRSGGSFVLIGMPGMPRGVDWTSMWFKELTVHAAYAYGPERMADGVHDTFELAMDLMREWGPRLAPLVGPPFAIAEFPKALASALDTGRSGVAKTVMTPARG